MSRRRSRKFVKIEYGRTDTSLDEDSLQLKYYLEELGYTYVGPKFIEHHLQETQE